MFTAFIPYACAFTKVKKLNLQITVNSTVAFSLGRLNND